MRKILLVAPGFLAVFVGSPLYELLSPGWSARSPWFAWAGATLIVLGFAVQIWTRRASGKMYTGRVEIQQSHHLVTSGLYRTIRHPVYASFLLIALGMTVGYRSPIGLLSTGLLLLPGLVYRLRQEDQLLPAQFGAEYQDYRQRTWRLFPGLY